MQADFAALYSALNGNLDVSNFANTGGLYASIIKPTSLANATFGGNQTYSFLAPATTSVPLRIEGQPGQTADLIDIESTPASTPVFRIEPNGETHAFEYFAGTEGVQTVNGALRYGVDRGGFTDATIASNDVACPSGVCSDIMGVFTNTGSLMLSLDHSGNFYVPGGVNAQSVGVSGNVVFGNGTTGGTLNGSTGNASISNQFQGRSISVTQDAGMGSLYVTNGSELHATQIDTTLAVNGATSTHGISDSSGIGTSGGITAGAGVAASGQVNGYGGLGAYNGPSSGTVLFGTSGAGDFDYNTTYANTFVVNHGFYALGSIASVNSSSQGSYYFGSSGSNYLDFNQSISGAFNFNHNLNAAGSIASNTGSTSGAYYFGTSGVAKLDYNTLYANTFGFNGSVRSSGVITADSGFSTSATSVFAGVNAGSISASALNSSNQVTGKSSSASATSYVPPVYNTSGGAISSNFHGVFLAGTTGSGTSSCGTTGSAHCASITLPSNIAFSGRTTYACSLTTETGAPAYSYMGTNSNFPQSNDGTHFYLVSDDASATVTSMCWGY